MNFEPHLPHTLNPSTICFKPLYPKLWTSCHKFWMTHTLNPSTIQSEPPNHKLWTSLTQTLNPLDHKQWTMLNKHDTECWTHNKPQTLHPFSAESTENLLLFFLLTASCPENQDGRNSKLPNQPRWSKQQVAQKTKMAKTASCQGNQDGQTSRLPRQLRWPNQQVAQTTKLAKTASCPDNQAAQNRRLPRQPSYPKQEAAQTIKLPKTGGCPDNQATQNSKLPRVPSCPKQKDALCRWLLFHFSCTCQESAQTEQFLTKVACREPSSVTVVMVYRRCSRLVT